MSFLLLAQSSEDNRVTQESELKALLLISWVQYYLLENKFHVAFKVRAVSPEIQFLWNKMCVEC